MTIEEAKNYGATHCLLNPSKKFIQLYFRYKTIKINDGTTREVLQYLSSFKVWMGSSTEGQDKKIIKLEEL